MCGLVGSAGNLLYQDEFIIKRMLFFDYVRGPDSTGLAAVRTNGDIEVAKAALNPIDFMQYEPFKKVCNGSASRAFIGHNRLRTRGNISSFTAHPFHFGHIVGAHNGTLDYQSVKRLEEALGMTFDVDSRAIFAGFEKLGVKETIELCTEGKEKNDGAWALTWYDKDKGTLNFLRNKHRLLYYAYEKGFKRMYWASEDWMMREAISASPNSFEYYAEDRKDAKNVAFFLFEPDVWYQYDLAELCKGGDKRPKPLVTPLKGREPESAATSGTVDPFGRGENQKWFRPTGASGTRTITATKTKSDTSTSSPLKRNIVLDGSATRPYAGLVTEESFNTYGKECTYCDTPIVFGDGGVTFFERTQQILCAKCSSTNRTSLTRVYVPSDTFEIFC